MSFFGNAASGAASGAAVGGPWGAAIGAGISTIGGWLFNRSANKQNRINAERERQFQREMADYSWNKDLEMWNLNNQYNSPSAQIARMKEAGLNPALAYGGSGVSGNLSTTTPKYQKYDTPVEKFSPYEFPNFLQNLGAYQDFQIKKIQTDNLKADLEAKKLTNSVLWEKLTWGNEKLKSEAVMKSLESGLNEDLTNASPFLNRYQAQTKQVELNNALKGLDYELKKRGGTWSDKALLRYMLLDGGTINDGRYTGMEKYLLLDTIGTGLKYGAGMFGLKNLFRKSTSTGLKPYRGQRFATVDTHTGELFK